MDEREGRERAIQSQPTGFILISTYPDYVYKLLARARNEGQWYAAQSIAAGYCFNVLALFSFIARS